MPIDYEKLLALDIPEVTQTYTQADTILYALGLGLGQDPMDVRQLAYVYEKDLRALPMMACVLAHPRAWLYAADTGIDWPRVVHGEQGIRLHRPLPVAGTVRGKSRIVEIVDKGAGRGAIIYMQREVVDAADGALLASVMQSTFCRGDGGFGGPRQVSAELQAAFSQAPPERAPDLVCDLATRPEAALLYRLSGDFNPLHADPDFAKAAGFPRPILHGLATFGVAGHALLRSACGDDLARLRAMAGRFSAPVFPGETIRTEFWRDGSVVNFRARVVARDVLAITNGYAEIIE